MFRRRPRTRPRLERQADGVPRRGLHREPVRVERIDPSVTGSGPDGHALEFVVEVRDADGRRCADLAVEVRVVTPDRTVTAMATTDLFGRIRVRTGGSAGSYRVEVLDVAAGGLAWDRDAGPMASEATVA